MTASAIAKPLQSSDVGSACLRGSRSHGQQVSQLSCLRVLFTCPSWTSLADVTATPDVGSVRFLVQVWVFAVFCADKGWDFHLFKSL